MTTVAMPAFHVPGASFAGAAAVPRIARHTDMIAVTTINTLLCLSNLSSILIPPIAQVHEICVPCCHRDSERRHHEKDSGRCGDRGHRELRTGFERLEQSETR